MLALQEKKFKIFVTSVFRQGQSNTVRLEKMASPRWNSIIVCFIQIRIGNAEIVLVYLV
jgi:hypothetical protein